MKSNGQRVIVGNRFALGRGKWWDRALAITRHMPVNASQENCHETPTEKSVAELVVSMVLGPASVVLAWSAARELGKQWHYEAALSADHELIQTGPYRFIRHPIYTSMFGMLMAIGAAYTWWPMWIAGTIFFVIGTEIRVRAEDRLLADRFQQKFESYREHVHAYIPFIH